MITMKEKTYKAAKIAIFVVALLIAYLFALNGRYVYTESGNDYAFDRWTCRMFTFDESGKRVNFDE